ncbi:MAG: phosphatidylserine/phosphatidylglycerophosphate/cardiolipin synthase family protein [Candidatus Sericytochromatia bacterium]|nr:phosphatidylserine/phosphatidylglycerophosphate/cardiolipin synthase family protein [Candidatus Sericytochromatia bacterium]
MRSRMVLASLLLAAGCAAPTFSPVLRPLLNGPMSRVSATDAAMELMVDGKEIFPAAFDLIDNAKKSIQMTFFLFGGDLGRQIGDKLLAKKAAGVNVQLIVDPAYGQTPKVMAQIKPVIESLRAKGLEIRTYPVKLLPAPKPWLKAAAITHAKLLVADGEVAMMGGMNFLDSEMINRDYMVRVHGGLAAHIGDVMQGDWDFSGANPPPPKPKQEQNDWALGETTPTKQTIKPMWLSALNAASRSIDIEMLLMDHPEGIKALTDAHKRGVTVRVLLDKTNLGKHVSPLLEKLPLKGAPNWLAVRKLLDAGIAISWYKPRQQWEMLHAKTAVIDGSTGFIGSANFTTRAWGQNREVSLKFNDGPTITRLAGELAQDFQQRAEPVLALSGWQRFAAGVWERVMEGKLTLAEAEKELRTAPQDDTTPLDD